ncbi:uncharacterized protein BCR38DRAFT_503575 [Pseudomassariella vexata]|uniref:Uncharacterized protein n=1 Tax=Pseudomassariella vexata TaxID=1141098 RepID=A0A1Y2EFB4_9PEZI|nr:uncharacterized protein BCR38DRAFT_503575 [Pseudomassariella vexata]ORY70278.1 hypothetical protein BCR38DRAFT_503575 [Pseudomassariella vexata]
MDPYHPDGVQILRDAASLFLASKGESSEVTHHRKRSIPTMGSNKAQLLYDYILDNVYDYTYTSVMNGYGKLWKAEYKDKVVGALLAVQWYGNKTSGHIKSIEIDPKQHYATRKKHSGKRHHNEDLMHLDKSWYVGSTPKEMLSFYDKAWADEVERNFDDAKNLRAADFERNYFWYLHDVAVDESIGQELALKVKHELIQYYLSHVREFGDQLNNSDKTGGLAIRDLKSEPYGETFWKLCGFRVFQTGQQVIKDRDSLNLARALVNPRGDGRFTLLTCNMNRATEGQATDEQPDVDLEEKLKSILEMESGFEQRLTYRQGVVSVGKRNAHINARINRKSHDNYQLKAVAVGKWLKIIKPDIDVTVI